MAEATQYLFDYKEVLEQLIKKQGLHEGKWQLIFELGFGATNMKTPDPDGGGVVLRPAGVVTVQKIGINRTEDTNSLTVDAAEVNPKPPAQSKKRPTRKKH